jgi:hypothetical protein
VGSGGPLILEDDVGGSRIAMSDNDRSGQLQELSEKRWDARIPRLAAASQPAKLKTPQPYVGRSKNHGIARTINRHQQIKVCTASPGDTVNSEEVALYSAQCFQCGRVCLSTRQARVPREVRTWPAVRQN